MGRGKGLERCYAGPGGACVQEDGVEDVAARKNGDLVAAHCLDGESWLGVVVLLIKRCGG